MIKRDKRNEALTLTPKETLPITRFGLNYTHEMLKSGEMPSIRVGKRFFISRAALVKWLEDCGPQAEHIKSCSIGPARVS